ncbi:hypothetical protein [Rubellimicrobium arenae]|uniref:hypothetical protein n=1 Tax=Rubellimicrobium arenae TaxID=2817372 RepID=UPI001B3153B3|nr:hypothetical protein [Rubellimicrobium arenae]
MSKIILHIGTHKTATTSIQRFLRRHDWELRKRGYFYPDYTLIGKPGHYAHFGIVNALSGGHPKLSPDDAMAFFKEVVNASRDYDKTIISAESFYRHGWPKSARTPEKYWRARKDYISRIQDLFGDAEVVVVFRAQAEYAESLYQETVKATKLKEGFDRFLTTHWPHFAFAEQADAWNETFPGLVALSYHKLVESGDAVKEFCRLLSIPIEGFPPAERFNERMPHDLLALKRLVNGTASADKEALLKMIVELGEIMGKGKSSGKEKRSFFASEAARGAFQDSFTQSNEQLRRFMPHVFAPDERVLPTTFAAVDAFGDQPSADFMFDLVRRTIEQHDKAQLQVT